MVRTKADSCAKAVGGKATRKPLSTPAGSSGSVKGGKSAGGNPYHPRETPPWQKEITNFFSPQQQAAQESVRDDCGSSGESGSTSSDVKENCN